MRIKICLGILIAVIVASSTVAYLRVRFQYEDRLAFLKGQLLEDAERLSARTKGQGLWSGSEGDWEGFVRETFLESNPGLLVNIFSPERRRLYSNCLGKECQWQWPIRVEVTNGVYEEDSQPSNGRLKFVSLSQSVPLGEAEVFVQLVRGQERFRIYGAEFNSKWLLYTILALSSIFLVSVLLTVWVLRPLGQLAAYVENFAGQIRNHIPQTEPMNPKWLKNSHSRDEFYRMSRAVRELSDKVHFHANLTRHWTFQMAHELKTPLSILRVEIEDLKQHQGSGVKPSKIDELLAEIDRLGQVISSFLSWAEVEGSVSPLQLNSVKVESLLEREVARLSQIFPDRDIRLTIEESVSLLVHPHHLEQLVINLLDNALKYSESGAVDVILSQGSLQFKDRGPGIPLEVLKRMGSPFNRGNDIKREQVSSNGLGLAWVFSIARKYGWRLDVHSSPQGTTIEVNFSN